MKIDQLQYFLAVSRTEHIGKASKILNISPSAISHSIAQLEEELGQPLVEKIGKNITLTTHGKRLAERVEKILAELDNTKQEIASAHVEWQGHFRIGATHGLMARLIVPSWAPLQNAHSQIVAEFFSFRSAQVVENVHSGILDLGFCYAPLPTPGVLVEKLMDVPLRLVVRPKHPALKMKPAALKVWLNETPCALPKAFQGIDVCEQHPEFKKAGIVPRVSFIFDAYEVAAAYLKGSDAWGFVPEPFCTWHDLQDLKLPGWKATTTISAVYPKGRSLARPLAELVKNTGKR